MEENKGLHFRVLVEQNDEFGQKFTGEVKESNIELCDETPADKLINMFERAFEACGFNKNYIKEYYGSNEL